MMYDHIIEMIIPLFKWYDELDNEGDRFFLSKEECDADVEIYRRYGYRPIGKKIQYIKVDYELPSPGILLAYMSCWFMERKLLEVTDVGDIIFLWTSKKIPGTLNKELLYQRLKKIDREEIDNTLPRIDLVICNLFNDCYDKLRKHRGT